MDKSSRSLLKAFSWRIIASFTTLVVIILSGNFFFEVEKFKNFYQFSFWAALLDFVSKLLLYFFHERIWQRINFGKVIKK